MARKQELGESVKEIKVAIKDKKIIIGSEATLKAIKQNKVKKVFYASNCPDKKLQILQKYCKLAKVDLVQIGYSNEEIGVFCKRQHFISVLGIGA